MKDVFDKRRIAVLALCLLVLILTSGPIAAKAGKIVGVDLWAVRQVKGIAAQTFYEERVVPQTVVSRSVRTVEQSENAFESVGNEKNVTLPLTPQQMVANLKASGIGEEKNEAICLIAEMLLNDGKEAAFVAGVCGNVLCEGRNGMFERDWGGSTQKYLPSRMPGDPYNYNARYGNRHIYDGFSLSAVYKMAKNMYYSYNWDTGNYKFGLGCVQWTHKRTITIIEYYIAEANGSDTITREQCVAAEMKFIDYELNNTETAAYEHWIAGDHKSKYKSDAARAGYCVARYYERCHSDYYSMRAQRAQEVYDIMTGKDKTVFTQAVEQSQSEAQSETDE
jgi:hypothetical protein